MNDEALDRAQAPLARLCLTTQGATLRPGQPTPDSVPVGRLLDRQRVVQALGSDRATPADQAGPTHPQALTREEDGLIHAEARRPRAPPFRLRIHRPARYPTSDHESRPEADNRKDVPMSTNTTFLVPEVGPDRVEHPRTVLNEARAEDMRRPLTAEGLAASWGLTVDQLLDGMTPEEKAVIPGVFKNINVRARLATARDGYGDAPTSDHVRALLRAMAREYIASAEVLARGNALLAEVTTCSCCHQVDPSTRTRNVGPDMSGTVCSPCASAIAAVLDERARKDRQRLGHAAIWLDRQA